MAEFKFPKSVLSDLTPNPGIGVKQGLKLRTNESTSYTRVPNIMSVSWLPTFGVARGADDKINLAANAVIAKCRAVMHRPNVGFEASDSLMAIMAGASAATGVEFVRFAAKCLHYENKQSRYGRAALLRALGLDYADWQENLPNIKLTINKWAIDMAEIPFPDVFSLIRTHVGMCSNVFKDDDRIKTQLYVFRPSHLWSYLEVDTARQLLPVGFTPFINDSDAATPKTWAETKAVINGLIAAMTGSEDFQMINGALLAAYPNNMYRIEPYDDASIEAGPDFVTNDEVGCALQNALLMGRFVNTTGTIQSFAPKVSAGPTVTINPGFDVDAELFGNGPAPADFRNTHIFSGSTELVTSAEAAHNARWYPVVSKVDGVARCEILSCGTEVMLSASIIPLIDTEGKYTKESYGYKMPNSLLLNLDKWSFNPDFYGTVISSVNQEYIPFALSIIRSFAHAPIFELHANTNGAYSLYIDWHNAYKLNDEELINIFEGIIEGAFTGEIPAQTGGTEGDKPPKEDKPPKK